VRDERKVYVTSQYEALLCCFLGRFLPKLGGATAPSLFVRPISMSYFAAKSNLAGATVVTRKVFAQARADPETAQQPIEDVNILICVFANSVSRESFYYPRLFTHHDTQLDLCESENSARHNHIARRRVTDFGERTTKLVEVH
jgi:hypothetical protein